MNVVIELTYEPSAYELDLLRAWWVRCPSAREGSRLVVTVDGVVLHDYPYPPLNGPDDG